MMAMSSLAFDTHAAVKQLQGAGADERLAEAFVSTFGSMLNENVATKSDVAALKSDIEKLELRITNKLYAAVILVVTLVVSLVKLLDWIIG